jgi:hypothetical protein
MPKTKSWLLFVQALEKVYSKMYKEFGKLPEYTPVELLIRNSRVPTWMRNVVPCSFPTLTLLTWVDSLFVYKRILDNKFEEIEDFSIENAILRSFSDSYELYWLKSETVCHIEKKKLSVPVGLFTTNSQDELVICPWFI